MYQIHDYLEYILNPNRRNSFNFKGSACSLCCLMSDRTYGQFGVGYMQRMPNLFSLVLVKAKSTMKVLNHYLGTGANP